jgi:hypothetical protein
VRTRASSRAPAIEQEGGKAGKDEQLGVRRAMARTSRRAILS